MVDLKRLVRFLVTDPTWGFVAAIGVSLVSSVMTVVYIHAMQNDLQSMYRSDALGQNYIQSAWIKLLSVNREILDLLLVTSAGERAGVMARIDAAKRDLVTLIGKSRPSFRSRRASALVRAAGRQLTECTRLVDTVIDLVKRDRKEEALAVTSVRLKEHFAVEDSLLNALDDLKQKHDIRIYREIDYELSISILFTVLTLVPAIGFRIFVYRNRAKPGGKTGRRPWLRTLRSTIPRPL